MPDENKEAKKVCPNCNAEMETTENGLYCTPCDLTFSQAKGRVKVEAGGKGRMQELEESIMLLQNENDKIKKALFGTNEPFWMG
jgi:predicted amidophosphoribosyltransferase